MTDTVTLDMTGVSDGAGTAPRPLVDASSASSPTMLAQFMATIAVKPASAPITVRVPGLADTTVRYRTDFDFEDLQRWQEWARREDGVIDGLVLATHGMVATCEAIVVAGKVLIDTDGTTVTFASRFPDVMDPTQAPRRLYRKDFHLVAIWGKVCERAGFGAEVDVVDPSQP